MKISIQDAIHQQIEKYHNNYGMSPKEINQGNCDQFAEDVLIYMEGKEGIDLKEVSIEDNASYSPLSGFTFPAFEPSHVWIVYRGKCYDSECLEGVDSYKELPFFKRVYIKSEKKIGERIKQSNYDII